MSVYDVAVIGAGPGGYVAAIRCAQLGLKTVCIDDREKDGKVLLGGTCLNVGCIPSKALLESSGNYEKAKHSFPSQGIMIGSLGLDLHAMQERKHKIVETHTNGIAFLFRKNKIDSVLGRAKIVSGGETYTLETSSGDKVEAKHVIIATGSSPRKIEGIPFGSNIVDSSGALSFEEVPKRLGIIGAGAIGLELGSVWRRLGSEVTLLESASEFLPLADEKVSKEAWRLFGRDHGWTMKLGIKIISINEKDCNVNVVYEDKSGRIEQDFDKVIVATGRLPNTQDIADDSLGLAIGEKGFIRIDAQCRTNLPRVYAIGDVAGGAMLAHKASEEGVMAAELIAGMKTEFDRNIVPWVIYTSPEIAWVGKTERQLIDAGIEYKVGQFTFSANGRAQALGEAKGFAKMLSDASTDRVLGVHIIGPFASELIGETVLAMAFSASSEDIALTVHAHPSLSEAIHEAALAVAGRALHI
jgi:dihydrolipoamide dehydrogenase